MTGENRLANAASAIAAGRDAIRAAEALLGLSLLRDAMSCAYYAVFHAARALLLLEGIEAKSHGGVLRLVADRLVHTGKLDAKVNVLLAKLQAVRHESDYGYAFDLDAQDAADAVAEASTFVERAAAAVAAAMP